MAPLKAMGDLAELKGRGRPRTTRLPGSFPFGEDSDYDLIADLDGELHRVQVK